MHMMPLCAVLGASRRFQPAVERAQQRLKLPRSSHVGIKRESAVVGGFRHLVGAFTQRLKALRSA
eukprot:7419968-Alexandrium_andersonii.AAC.1